MLLPTLTFAVDGAVEDVLNYVIRGVHGVLAPGFAVVASQNHDLSLSTTQRREVRHFQHHWTQKLGSD